MGNNKVRCAQCGKTLYSYDRSSFRRYGSPLRQCRKCGADYIDVRFHEMAAEGENPSEFNIRSYAVLIIIGLLVAYRGYYLLGMKQMRTPDELQWLLPSVFMLMGAVLFAGGIYEIISVKTGRKAARFKILKAESEERLRDRSYAQRLKNAGYSVPDRYL